MDLIVGTLVQGLALSMMALGIFISMKIFNIPDITTDGSYTLGGVITGMALMAGWEGWMVFPLVMMAGGVAGAATGTIHTRLGIHPLLSGILVMTALYSINLMLLGRSNVPLLDTDHLFTMLSLFETMDLNTLMILGAGVILFVLCLSYLLKTDFGLSMRATGNSETMIRAQGVNTDAMKIIGLALSNSLVAMSGYLMSQYQGFVDINMGIGIVITGLGSVIIGESLMQVSGTRSIVLSLVFMVLGTLLFQSVLSVSLMLGVHPNMLKLITAIFVLLIVGIPKLKTRSTKG
jgi:putative ABC transport system permease protein